MYNEKNARCVLYVREDLGCKVREDLMDENFPEIWIEIGEANKKRSMLCLYYREFSEWNARETTNSIKSQCERFNSWLAKTSDQIEKNQELWIIGDFNVDLRRKTDNEYNRKVLAQIANQSLLKEECYN